ncbi:MAG: T9SS type A sorting domain-containing protein, partial [Bacteroidota bacterium]
ILSTTDITVSLDDNGQASITPSEIITSVSDNCSIADTVITQTEFTNDDIGEVTVNVTVEDGSGNTAAKSAIVTVNLEETGIHTIAGQKIKVYPNPAKGFVYIDTEIESLQVKIINLNGKTMYEGFTGNTSNKINIDSFPEGLYLLQLKKDDNIINQKLMVK